MRMKPVVVFGAGEIAEVAHFYLTRDAGRDIAAFTVDEAFLTTERMCDRPVVPFEKVEERYSPLEHEFFVATSYARLNGVRAQKCAEAKAKGYRLTSYVSNKATTWPDLRVGDNCFILEDNTIQPFVAIGNNVTMWSGNHIGHHAVIRDNCFITSHVVVSGGVVIEENSFIGVNATLRDHIRVGRNCVIGAGSLILQDCADFSVFTQAPAELSRVPSNRLRKI
jgi:sugar O-acyltransferase (sialic acid O-acetyltransferase NeuD family)